MRKYPYFDRLEGPNPEIWLRIRHKHPYGWYIPSLNMEHLARLSDQQFADNTRWTVRMDSSTQPQSFYLILRIRGVTRDEAYRVMGLDRK
jgi:hypothetical protein